MAETGRMRALRSLKANMPIADRQTANQIQAGNNFLLQRAVGQAPLQGSAPQTAQQIGTGLATQTGQQQVAEANKQRTTAQQVGNLAQGAQQMQFQGQLGQDQRVAQSKLFEGQQRLGQIDENAKQEIFDSRMQLANQDMSNKFLNERNLMDYQLMQGKSEEQMRDYAQTAQQAYQRQQYLMETAYKKLLQGLDEEYQKGNLKLDQAQTIRLTNFKKQVEAQMRKKQAKASGLQQMLGGIGMVAGAVVGTIVSPGAGTAAGASIGSGLGSLAGGAATSS